MQKGNRCSLWECLLAVFSCAGHVDPAHFSSQGGIRLRPLRRNNLLVLLALFVVVALVTSACGSATEPTPEGETGTETGTGGEEEPAHPIGGEMVYSASGDPVNFNPILQSDTTSGWVVGRVYDGLITTNENLEVIPELATDWEFSDDGLEWTFHIHDGVYFHDGEQLTAEDVAYTFNAIKDPGYTGPRTSDFEALDRAEVVDDLTVKFYLSKPYAPFLTELGYGILPSHLYSDKPVSEMAENPYNREPIGAGPYKFGEWATGQYIVLERNEDYYGEGPYIEQVRLKFVQDSNVAVAALEAGEVDVLGLPPKEVERIQQDYADKFNFYVSKRLGFQYVGLNHERFGLSDPAVRNAMAYGINRQAILDDIAEGNGFLMDGPFVPVTWAYDDDAVKRHPYDPEKAIQVLEEAGYTRGDDGIFEKDGQPLSYTLLTNSGNTTREAITLMIQDNLKDVGIEINPEYVEWSVFLEKHLWVGNVDMWVSGFSLGVDPDAYVFYHSSMADKNEQGRFKGFNRAQFRNEEVDQLLEQGRTTLDKEQRKEIYSDFQRVMTEQMPWIWLYSYKTTYAVDKKINGVVVSPQGLLYSYKWWIEE